MSRNWIWLVFCCVSLFGCNFDVIAGLENSPVCGDEPDDADCPVTGSSSSETGASSPALPTTSGGVEGVMTTTEDTAVTSSEPTTGDSTGSTTAEPPAAAPKIVSVALAPDEIVKAGAIAVQVEASNASDVTMTVDDGEPVTLAASGADFYQGAIEIYGSSMNGGHSVLITAKNAGLIDTWLADFAVAAPPAGENIWLKTNAVPHSQTRAVAVDRDSNLYEVGTSGTGAAARLVASKRDEHGKISWPGMWMVYHEQESRGEDVAMAPDGKIYVLGNYQDNDQHTRWWLARLDPAVGALVGDPEIGEVDEPARGLAVADNGDIVIAGTAVVWGEQNADDVQVKIWILPTGGNGINKEWGYSPLMKNHKFSEVPEDVAIVGERIFVTGSVEGIHPGDLDFISRKRLFVVEMNFNGVIARTYVAGNQPYQRSGGYAVADDGAGGVVTAGWACNDVCTQVGDMHWLKSGAEEFTLHDRQQEVGNAGPAYALDVAYSPSGYNVFASAVGMSPGLNLALRVTGRRPKEPSPVLSYTFDTGEIEMGQAVAVGPHGYVWFAGLRMLDDTLWAVAGKCHGY
jgi:hypothetical protein